MKDKKITLTIGIPVYNEEKTIVPLIRSLIGQISTLYILEKIIIVSDGTTDKTIKKIEENFNHNNIVNVVRRRKTKGKSKRLLEIFRMNKSDIVMIFDGDITIIDTSLLNKLISEFKNPSVALVSGNTKPIKPKQFFGKVWFAEENIWYESRKDYKKGDNLYNSSGQGIALTKNFAKKVYLPPNIVADQQFVYLSLIKQEKKFKFVQNAITYYVPPSTLKDIVFQIKRSVTEESFLYKHFDRSYKKYFYMPKIQKIKGLFRAIIKEPFYTMIALLLLNFLRLVVRNEDPLTKKGLWKTASSTKILIK